MDKDQLKDNYPMGKQQIGLVLTIKVRLLAESSGMVTIVNG